jgi:putative acetyltransferase
MYKTVIVILPNNYSYFEAKNAHGKIASEIIFSVLDEYRIGGFTHHSDDSLNEIERSFAGGFFGLIKNEAEEIVGTFGLYKLSETNCEIRKMYLLPKARGNGLGKWMVYFLIEKAKELGYQKIELDTASVLLEAIELYQKMGFKEVAACNDSPRCDRAFAMDI